MPEINLTASHRLAIYGTLAPGRVNHHHVADIVGHWLKGEVRGRLLEAGWGADLGYPGIILDETEDEVEVFVLESPDLPEHLPRLDEFEGEEYLRRVVRVQTKTGELEAMI